MKEAGLFSLEEGKELVELARKSIGYAIASGALLREKTQKKEFTEKRGAFVSLHTFPEHELRGCIGFPEPIAPLWNAVIECAASAAFSDPRFPALKAAELEKVVVEVSVLTKPEEIKSAKEEMPSEVKIGKDGLIARKGNRSGLLLPQVAPEWKWDSGQFLSATCEKAGLPKNAWREEGCRIFKFKAQIFREEQPKGEVLEATEQ
ncbi:MAG: TIGR00296 family protein [Candidatus Diapherotrites archaeon]